MHLPLEFLGGQSPAGDGEEDPTLITARDVGLLEQTPRDDPAKTVASSPAKGASGNLPHSVEGSASSGSTTGACMSSDGNDGAGEPLEDWPSLPGVAQPASDSDEGIRRDCVGQADVSRESGGALAGESGVPPSAHPQDARALKGPLARRIGARNPGMPTDPRDTEEQSSNVAKRPSLKPAALADMSHGGNSKTTATADRGQVPSLQKAAPSNDGPGTPPVKTSKLGQPRLAFTDDAPPDESCSDETRTIKAMKGKLTLEEDSKHTQQSKPSLLSAQSMRNLKGAIAQVSSSTFAGKTRSGGILKKSTRNWEKIEEKPDTHIRQRTIAFDIAPKKQGSEAETISWLGKQWPLITPDSRWDLRWAHASVLPTTYTSWVTPFRISLLGPGFNMLLILDIIFDLWFLVVMLSTLCRPVVTTDGLHKDKASILRQFWRKTFPVYIFPMCFLYLFVVMDVPFWVWILCSLVRIPRSWLLWKYFNSMAMKLEVNAKTLQVTKLLLILILSIHWIGCVFFFIARVQSFGDNTWVTRLNSNVIISVYSPNEDMAKSYIILMFKGICALTNIGYDPFRPDNPAEMLWAVVVMFLQIAVEAYILGTLFHHLVAKDASLDEFRRKSQMLHGFMEDRDLPPHLRTRLSRYIEFTFKKSKENYGAAIDIPRALQLRIASCQFKAVVDTCMVPGAPLRGCNEMFINNLMLKLQVMFLMPGEDFMRQGDIGREVGFVAAGVLDVISVESNVEFVVRSIHGSNLDMPTIVGEISFFLGMVQPFKVQCRSSGDAKVLVLSRSAYNDMLANYPEQNDIIVNNVLANFGLDSNGETLVGWSNDNADDESFIELRNLVLQAVVRRRDDLVNELTYAVSQGDVDLVKNLVRKGVDVNSSNYDKSSAMHLAALSGNTKVLETLIEEGADLNIVDRWGQTPLHAAVVSGNTLAVKLLSSNGARLSVQDPASELCSGAAAEDIPQLERLILNGVDPNIGDYDARAALHLAAAAGAQKSVEYLLSHGADPNVMDRWGVVPLMDAVKEGHAQVAEYVKSKGGCLPAEDRSMGAKLCDAAGAGDVRMLMLLKGAGVELDQGDYDSRYALHLAAANGKSLAVSYLLSICANPNVMDRWGSTPLEDALRRGHFHCARLLLSNGGRLGESPDDAVKAGYAKLDETVTMEEVRSQLKEMLDKGMDKIVVKGVTKEDVAVMYAANVNALGLLCGIRDSMDLLQMRYRALERRFKAMGTSLWESVQNIVKEGIVVEKPAASVGANAEAAQGAPSAPLWVEKFEEIDEAMLDDSRSSNLKHGRLTMREEQLFEDLDAMLAGISGSEGESVDGDGDADDGGSVGPGGGGGGVQLSAAEMAKAFQSSVVAHLNELQIGFDCALDEFYQCTRNSDEMINTELPEYLKRLACSYDPPQVEAIMTEIKSAKDGSADGETISLHDLWQYSATFWTLMRGLQPKGALLARLGSMNRTGSIGRTTSKDEGFVGAAEPASTPEDKRQAVSRSMDIILETYDICRGTSNEVSTSNLASIHKRLGEFGAPLFAKIFDANTMNEASLRKEKFVECFLMYLNPSVDDGDSARGEEDEVLSITEWQDEQTPLMWKRVGAKATAALAGASKLAMAVKAAIKMPLSQKGLRRELLRREVVSQYIVVFERITGSRSKPLRRQNVRSFLAQLLPQYLITETHVDTFVTLVSAGQGDGGILTWESIFTYLKTTLDPENQADDGGNPAELRTMSRAEKAPFGIILPQSKLKRVWKWIISACGIYNFIIVPIQICSQQVQESLAINAANYFVDALFVLDIVASFNSAYFDNNSILVTSREKIFRKYATGEFLIDLPLAAPLSLIAWHSPDEIKAWLRLPKVVRVRSAYQHWKAGAGSMQGDGLLKSILKLLLMSLAVTHLCAAIFLKLGVFGSPAWLDRGIDFGALRTDDVWNQYLLCFYYVLSTFSTQGVVGELTPSTFQELIFTFCLMILTLTLFAYILGEISSLIMKADDEVAEARSKQAMVDNFIKSKKGITQDIVEDIQDYSKSAASQRHDQDMDQIYGLMSHSLQIQVAECISRDMLDDIPLFKDCTPVFLDSLAVLLRESQHAPGEVLFRTNEVAKDLYIVVSGAAERWIEMEDDEPLLDGKSIAGQCIGDLSFFFQMRQFYTCKVVSQTTCLMLERVTFGQLLKMYPDEEDTIARNALNTYEATMNRAGSMASGKSGASAKSVQSELDNIMGSNLKHTIKVLKHRRKVEAVEKTLKACSRGNIQEVRKNMLRGVSVNSSNRDGRTPLHMACSHGHEEMVRVLVDEMGADINPEDKHGNTPINDAVRHKHDKCAEILRSRGVKLRYPAEEMAVQLCQAAFNDDMDMIQRYVRNGADLSAGDYDGRTCMHLAASEGRMEIVKYLLDMGTDPNVTDRMGSTPMEDAIRHGHREVQRVLRDSGAMLVGHADTMCTAAATGDIDTIRTMISNGINPNTGDYDGRTALHLAACEGQLGVIHFLLGYHNLPQYPGLEPCNINPIDSFGGTPLDDALRHKNRVVEILLRENGGICRDDPAAMQAAAEKQATQRKKQFAREIAIKADKLVRVSQESKRVRSVESYMETVRGYDKVLDGEMAELSKELQSAIKLEKEYVAKLRVKRARNPDKAAHQKRMQSLRDKIGQISPILTEWKDNLENPPSLPVAAHRWLVSAPLEEEEEEEEEKEEVVQKDYASECSSALGRLIEIFTCLEEMV